MTLFHGEQRASISRIQSSLFTRGRVTFDRFFEAARRFSFLVLFSFQARLLLESPRIIESRFDSLF